MTKHKHYWPKHMDIEELFNNDNGLRNHVHVASKDRKKLIQLGHVAAERFGGEVYVREFKPFDPVDPVHTSGSWHYRDSSNPDTPRDYSNRGNGLAFDFGSPQRQAFADECKHRYSPKECDF